MAHKVERIQAKILYVQDGLDVAEIVKRLVTKSGQQIPEKTVYRWMKEDKEGGSDWDEERASILNTSHGMAKEMKEAAVAKMRDIMEKMKESGDLNASEVYALRQLMLSADSLDKRTDYLGIIILMLNELTDFLSVEDPETLNVLSPHIQKFSQTMRVKYGKK